MSINKGKKSSIKICLVTGFNSGIGKKTSEILLADNYKLILLGKRNTSFIKKNFKDKVDFYKVDFNNLNKLTTIIKKIKKKYKNINYIVHCAGLNHTKKIQNLKLNDWKEVFNINLTSIFLIIKILFKNIILKKSGSIVIVSSIAGHRRSLVSGCHYVSSKSAQIGLVKQLSLELGRYNVRINCLAPSQTYTKMLRKSMSKKQIDNLKKQIPLRRLATVDDQANVIYFLLSENSKYINGSCVNVDGGQI
jgi:3-oxoacyl-[acyl-carrier protein] reductase